MRQLCILAVILMLISLWGCGDKVETLSFEVINTTLADSSCSDCKASIVYVKNFSDNDPDWKAIEQFGMQYHDTAIVLETIYFIHDSSNTSPGLITFKQFDETFLQFEIGEHAIIEGVSYFRADPRGGLRGF